VATARRPGTPEMLQRRWSASSDDGSSSQDDGNALATTVCHPGKYSVVSGDGASSSDDGLSWTDRKKLRGAVLPRYRPTARASSAQGTALGGPLEPDAA